MSNNVYEATRRAYLVRKTETLDLEGFKQQAKISTKLASLETYDSAAMLSYQKEAAVLTAIALYIYGAEKWEKGE